MRGKLISVVSTMKRTALSLLEHIPHREKHTGISQIEQKIVVKVIGMSDNKTKQKAIEAVSSIFGVDSITVDLKDQKVTVVGKIDFMDVSSKLKKLGRVEIVSIGPAKEEKKDGKK